MNEKKSTKDPKQRFSLNQRIKSFSFAFQGLRTFWKEEHNASVHVFATLLVILAGIYFEVSEMEWCLLIFSVILVIAAECFNSALEKLCDLVTVEYHPVIKKVKDLSAAAVLLCALGAAFVGLIVFIPHVFN